MGGTCISGPSFNPVEWGQGVSMQKNRLFNRNIPGGLSVPPVASLLPNLSPPLPSVVSIYPPSSPTYNTAVKRQCELKMCS